MSHAPFVNGQDWHQPEFPYFHGTLQWVDGDKWMLMTPPYASRFGGQARMPIDDPDGSGKIIYSAADMSERLSRHRWQPEL